MTELQLSAFAAAVQYAVERNAREYHELHASLTASLERATIGGSND